MGFAEAVRTCLFRKYADFQGRASRAEYWWFALFAFAAAVVLFAALRPSPGLLVAGGLVVLVLFVPHLAVSVRRLHDTDRSGWWVLLGMVGPVLDPSSGSLQFAGWIAQLVLIWFLVQKGDPGGNRFGPKPGQAAVLGLPGSPPRTGA